MAEEVKRSVKRRQKVATDNPESAVQQPVAENQVVEGKKEKHQYQKDLEAAGVFDPNNSAEDYYYKGSDQKKEEKPEKETVSQPDDWESLKAEAVKGYDHNIKTTEDFIRYNLNRPESEKDRKKRERIERSRKVIASLSDGLSALGNLFYTNKYAPNMYDNDKMGQTKAVRNRLDKLKEDRDKNDEAYYKMQARLGDLEAQRAKTIRDIEDAKAKQALAERKAENDKKRLDAYLDLMGYKREGQKTDNELKEEKLRGAKADADKKQVQAKHEEQNQKDKHNESVSRKSKNDRTGHGHKSGGGGGSSSKNSKGGSGSKNSKGSSSKTVTREEYGKDGKLKKTVVTTTTPGSSGKKPDKWSNTRGIKW